MNIEKLIKDNVGKLSSSSMYISPDIPEKKLNNAIASIATGEVEASHVLAVYDGTIFGSAKEGVLFVGDRIYCHSMSDRIVLKFADIVSTKVTEYTETKNDGEEKINKRYSVNTVDGEVDVTHCLCGMSKDGFMEFINLILENIKENDGTLETTNQTCPLAMMSGEIKEAYIKLICNYAYADDGVVDASEYAEIMALIAMNSIERDVRLNIRSYMYDESAKMSNDELIEILVQKVDAGSLDALKLSIVKDTINMHWNKMSGKQDVIEWKESEYIVNLAAKLSVSDEQVDYIAENIKKNKEIIDNRQDDIQIKKNMQELAAKAGAVGVPLAAIYLSGSVIGVSAAGMTSGLAALGMGGVLGFSSMFTGIGVAVLLGVGAYKGVKKITGMGDLEKNKQREKMLQEIAKNSQKALNYLVEDVNEITSRLQAAIAKGQENELKIQKLAGILAMMSNGATHTTKQIDFAEKEKLICRLPAKINKSVIEEMAPGATKLQIRELIYSAYTQTKTDSEGNTVDNCLNMELSIYELENVYNALEGIGFYSMTDNTKAQALNAAKGFMKGIIG